MYTVLGYSKKIFPRLEMRNLYENSKKHYEYNNKFVDLFCQSLRSPKLQWMANMERKHRVAQWNRYCDWVNHLTRKNILCKQKFYVV